VFVGYGNCEKGYRVYDLKPEKIVLSRSVIFSEDRACNWERNLMNQNRLSLNLEGGEVEGENSEEHSSAAQLDNVEHCHQNSTVGELAENIDSDNSQQSSPSSTLVKLKTLEDVYVSCHMCIIEPENYQEAFEDKAWQEAMKEELEVIKKNNTWELVERPIDKLVIGVKWVYKTKLHLDETIQKHKAHLVAKGYAQKSRIDYNETFAPVARLDTIRTLIALATQKGWKLF
jgi:hypothetical protein